MSTIQNPNVHDDFKGQVIRSSGRKRSTSVSRKSRIANPGNSQRLCIVVAVGLFLCLLLSGHAFAQVDTGTIAGRVLDPSSAIVIGAKVTATEINKNLTYTAQTGESGTFVLSPLPIGQYSVRIKKEGFRPDVAGPFQLNVQQSVAVNVTLAVGQVNQQVTVSSVNPQLDTLTSSLGQVISDRQMVTMPLNGRNFAELALLAVGVSPAEPGGRDSAAYGFSSDGSRSYQNDYILDGVDNNSNLTDLFTGTNYAIQPSVDAIQEFKVETNGYSAEFSRGTGAVVNISIKSGTNALHGDAWEFIRNDALDATNYFSTSKPAFRQNQFGGTLGGPVVFPGLYDGHNKTFFFADYEGLRIREGRVLTGFVPTLAERNGDFSSLIDYQSPIPGIFDCNGIQTYQGEIFNTRQTQIAPTSLTGLCGIPVGYNTLGQPSNILSSAQLDPAGETLSKLWGAPNLSGSGNNFESQPLQSTDQNNVDARIDQTISNKDRIFGRYSFESQPSTIPAIFQATGGYGPDFYAGHQSFRFDGLALGDTYVFTPNIVNEARFGFNRINAHRYPWAYQTNGTVLTGIPGIPFNPSIYNGGLPEFDFNGYSGTGTHSDLPTIEKQHTFEYNDTLTWIHGPSTMKAGFNALPQHFSISQPNAARGDFSFQPQFSDNPAAPGTGGNAVASMLLGIASQTQITDIIDIHYLRTVAGLFVQDYYRVRPNLTFSLGLRWDYFGNVHEADNNMGSFDIATGVLYVPRGKNVQLPPSLTPLMTLSATGSQSLVPQRYNSWSPRLGLAYSILPRLVFRAGYGLFWTGYENGPWSNPSPGYNPPFNQSQYFNPTCSAPSANPVLGPLNCANPQVSILSIGIPADALSNPNSPSLTSLNQQMQLPYFQDWHGSFQYQLPSNTLLEISYAGTKGTHLYTFFNGNQATPSSDPSAPTAPRRPYPLIDNTINELSTQGFSSYNGLQTRLEKRYSQGLEFLVSYAWQHSLDNASSANLQSNNNSSPRDFRQYPSLDYGNSDFDVRQRLVFSYIYDLPFGIGKKYGSEIPRAANWFLGGWQTAGILTLQSGNWYTATDGNANFANSDGNQYPDLAGDPNGKHCVPGTIFNTCAFKDPPLGSLGNSGRNIIQEPGTINWDTSFLKQLAISGPRHLEFRAEFFNILNHPNLTTTNLSFGSGNFGYASSASTQREIQGALKFYF